MIRTARIFLILALLLSAPSHAAKEGRRELKQARENLVALQEGIRPISDLKKDLAAGKDILPNLRLIAHSTIQYWERARVFENDPALAKDNWHPASDQWNLTYNYSVGIPYSLRFWSEISPALKDFLDKNQIPLEPRAFYAWTGFSDDPPRIENEHRRLLLEATALAMLALLETDSSPSVQVQSYLWLDSSFQEAGEWSQKEAFLRGFLAENRMTLVNDVLPKGFVPRSLDLAMGILMLLEIEDSGLSIPHLQNQISPGLDWKLARGHFNSKYPTALSNLFIRFWRPDSDGDLTLSEFVHVLARRALEKEKELAGN